MNLSLKDYVIELCDYYVDQEAKTTEQTIRLSSLIQGVASTTGVYNEKLTEKENSQYSLTFNIELFVDNARNPLIDFVVIGRKIRLKREGSKNIEFYITGKTPTFNNKGVSYAITCQDAFSYQFARQSIKITLNTNDEDQWGEYETGPRPIDELVEKVLEISYLNEWKINQDINNHIYQFPNNLYFSVEPMKVSIEVKESTPYNAILEIAKLFNAAILIDYDKKELNFINREKMTYKGLKLKPEINLSNFSYSEKGDNLYNIMYVSGGEDSQGNYLSISPTVPGVIGKILISTEDIRNKPDEETTINLPSLNNDNYYLYPAFYRLRGAPDVLYVKKLVNDIPQYVKTNITGFWEDCDTTNELKAYIMRCYNLLNDSDKSETDSEEITLFFRKLERVPHAGNFLYDFSYWRDNKLLSSFRYDKLMFLINRKLRNINLKLMVYSTTYNTFKFKLDQFIKKEEEIISLMAAEDSASANNTATNKDNSYMRYLSLCSWTDAEQVDLSNAYFPMGIVDENDATRNSVFYGKYIDENFVGYTVPDFSSIKAVGDGLKYYSLVDGKATEIHPVQFIDEGEIILFQERIASDSVYVQYIELKNYVTENVVPSVPYNSAGIADSKIIELQCQLISLWNEDYQYYYRSLYGDKWLENKIKEVNKKRQKYVDKKKKYEAQLLKQFGKNWRGIDTAEFPDLSDEYVTYCDLIQQLEDVSVYVGGEGKRTYDGKEESYSYKGIYNYYLSALNTIVVKKTKYESRPLEDIVNELREEQSVYEKEMYRDYADILSETYYSDNSQITDDGLYTAAYKQFMTYHKPTKSYSSTYITNYDLESAEESVEIGDLVELQHDLINEVLNKKSFIIKSDSLPSTITEVVVKYVSPVIIGNDIDYSKICHENAIYELQENNRLLIKMNQYLDFDIEKSMIQEIYVNGEIFNAYNYNSVEALEKVYKSEPVKLRVTGVTKDLRSKVAQLTVEENTLYNTLVDRLIYFLQG